jgi:tape measure domain-containing protein
MKMNFSIALKMTTDQFKRGADIVKNSLKSIQYQVLGMASALGLGTIGLKNMVSKFVDVARETTRARVALRNISGDAQGFSNNMNFLIKASNRWGQELNGMTSEFAKFSAAASSAGISIQDQHKIFESFTRSITAFGMSSADAHLSYLALSQMMSKGKISSEELRRQLGERMPVAMEAMARAVGVTIQELDGLLKAGKLISKDVMLPFVQEMEKMLPEVNVDNIETSVNRLKNTFTKLVQDLKIGEYFKKITDWANSMLSNIQSSFLRVFTTIGSAIVGGKLFKAYTSLAQNVKDTNAKILANKAQTEQQLELATAKRVAAEKRYNELSVLYSKATNEQKIQYYAKLTSAESAMNKARLREQAGLKAVQEANATQMVTRWGVAFNSLKKVAISVISTIKVAFSTILPMAVIGLLTNFVMKLVEARKEAQRIKNIYKDNVGSIFNVADTSEIQRLQTLHKIIKDRLGTEQQIKTAQSELLKLLGVEEGKQVDINKKVAERIMLLREAARADLAAQNNAQLEQRNRDILQKIAPNGDAIAFRQFYDKVQRVKGSMGGSLSDGAYYSIGKEFGLNVGNRFGSGEFANLIREFEQNTKAMEYNTQILENAVKISLGATETTTVGGTGKAKSVPEKITADKLYIQNTGEAHQPGSVVPITQSPFITKGQRDTTFDYKKSQSDILKEEYRLQEEYAEKLRDDAIKLGEYGKAAMEQVWKEEQKLTSLSDALKLAQLKEDIQDMNLSIFEQSIDGVTGFADALDRAARSWGRIANEDMSGFERMVAIINAIGDTIKGLMGTWEAYATLRDLISTKEQAIQAKDNILNAQKIANVSTLAAVEQGAAATSLATKSTEVAANTSVAATGAAASVASVPIIGPMLAIGAVASILGLLGSLPKFANGGVVAGVKGGDRNLVRVNGGEMIMTTPQQSKLWGAIKNGDFGGGSRQVEFVLKGKDLVGTEKIHNRRASRI